MSTVVRTAAVVGNSVAAMFAALTLGESGWKVALVTPSRRLGAHFAGLHHGGQRFDAGMVFLEFTSFNAQPDADIASYDPAVRNDVGRFFPLVERTLRRVDTWRQIETPHMRVQGCELPDLLIGNNLSALRALPAETRTRISDELRVLTAEGPGPLHPSRKAGDPQFAHFDFEAVSLANHGRTLHALCIEPFCRKLTASFTAAFLARRFRANAAARCALRRNLHQRHR